MKRNKESKTIGKKTLDYLVFKSFPLRCYNLLGLVPNRLFWWFPCFRDKFFPVKFYRKNPKIFVGFGSTLYLIDCDGRR